MKIFLLKAKHFFKRNIYPITVTMCTALVLGIIAISAYSAIKSSNTELPVNSNIPVESGNNVGSTNNDDNKKPDDEKPTGGETVIIFDLPFEGAVVSKDYAENILLYDNTTEMWCTHQGLDYKCAEKQQVKAVYAGTISKIENSMMNGTVVYLKITDELTVIYKGLSSDVKVKEGARVEKGTVIGTVTSMISEKADGVHLHIEMTKKGELIDPSDYFSDSK